MDSNTNLWEIKQSKITRLVKNVYNRFEKWYMRMYGYVPTTFNPYTNKYEYELKSEIDKAEREETEPFEIYAYDKTISPSHIPYTRWWCDNDSRRYQEQVRTRIKKTKSLSHGECADKPIFIRDTK